MASFLDSGLLAKFEDEEFSPPLFDSKKSQEAKEKKKKIEIENGSGSIDFITYFTVGW